METELSIEIDRPIAEVFAKTNDDVTAWSRTCVESETLSEADGVGSTFRIVTEERGRRMAFEGVVTKWEPPTLSGFRLVGDAFTIDVDYHFEDLGQGTRVTQSSDVNGKGVWKVFFALFGWLMKRSGCKAQQAELKGLKRYCESGERANPAREEQAAAKEGARA